MLVVDRVVLEAVEQLQQVRELERRRTLVAEDDLHPRDEVVQIRHLGEHVVADDEARPAAFRQRAARAVSRPKNSTSVGTPRSSAAAATFAAGSIPRIGTPVPTKCWSR